MRRLFPVTDATPGPDPAREAADREWSLAELADAYAYPDLAAPAGPPGPAGGPPDAAEAAEASAPPWWLRANMVSSLDGAAQHDGRSQPLSHPADMRIFGTLRALADVVLVGAETVRQEGYRPARARAEFAGRRAAADQPPAPAVAVVSRGLDLDFSLPLFASALAPTLVLTGATAPADRRAAAARAGVRVVTAGEGATVEPARALRELAALGQRRLLLEGGPRLLGQFVAAGLLDELCLTVAPLLTSGDAQRVAWGPTAPVPRRLALASLLEEEGFLFTRYARALPPAGGR